MDKRIDNREMEYHHLNLYLRNMQIIKYRLNVIKAVKTNRLPDNFSFFNNVEFCVLQIRKILELIAYSSLVSDADIYEQRLGSIEKMWNANLILKDIERIHANYYPRPIEVDPNDNTETKWIDKSKAYLSREEFEKVYNKCGKLLHEYSPFEQNSTIENEYNMVWNSIDEWVEHIEELLSTHIIWLYNERLFFIAFGDGDTEPKGRLMQKESAY